VAAPIVVKDSEETESKLMQSENAPEVPLLIVSVAPSIIAWNGLVRVSPSLVRVLVTSALVREVPLLGVKVIVGAGHSSSM